MQFVKLLKYVTKSFEDKPSFLILMSDGKEYISNGCVFVENTNVNREDLIDEYDCKNELNELLSAPDASLDDVTDARGMFTSCTKLISIKLNVPNATIAEAMFVGCTSLINAELDMPMVEDALTMFFGCTSLINAELNMPNITEACCMFNWCKSLTSIELDMPKVSSTIAMFNGCKSLDQKIISRYTND